MVARMPEVELRLVPTIAELAGVFPELEGPAENPFVSLPWLSALETTGCATARRGWLPQHLVASVDAEIVAVAPAYVKTHSEGEFIFDWGWASASDRAGIPYYPKLSIAVPFTPATGPRILVKKGADHALATAAVAAAMTRIPAQLELSSAHMLFPDAATADALEAHGLLHRLSLQYQWHNPGYATFEDFLATLPSKKRTQIRRERRAVAEQGITLETVRDEKLSPALADDVFELYAATVDKFFYGRRYLNRAFFEEVLGTMKSSIEVVLARDGSRIVAGAFNVRGTHALYGRYWGARAEVPFLHFAACYYHPIAECIERGIGRFEPGAGGEHKRARGFVPTICHSVHHVEHPRLRAAIADFVEREAMVVRAEAEGTGAEDDG